MYHFRKGASLKPRTLNTQTRTKKEDKFSEDDEVDTAELRDSRRENKNKKLDDIEAEMRQRKLHNLADNTMKSNLNKQFADEIAEQQNKAKKINKLFMRDTPC